MDENNFEARKKEVVDKITGILIEALEKETLTREEGQKIATFILSKKEGIKDENGITLFLEEITKNWSTFKVFFELQKKTTQVNMQDQEKVEKIKNQLSQLANNSTQS